MLSKKNASLFVCSVILTALVAEPGALYAQELEEIVVTAQRREQTLQEVPVSIEAFTGNEIARQGFRDMIELANFSPGAQIEPNQDRINITIRGVGTAGNNHALEQSAPTFVDGIHFGRSGQIFGAFLDVERIEILRGPQPVFFGQNANAGAFNVITRKPTDTWQGNVRAEVGNFQRQTLEFGFGGPLTETLGIRFSGKYDQSDGYLKDLLTRKTFPQYESLLGRVILQWEPNDRFRATLKYQRGRQESGGDGEAVQRGIGSDDPRYDRYGSQVLILGVPDADLAPVPDSFADGWGVTPGNTYLNPALAIIDGVPLPELEESDRTSIDLSGFAPAWLETCPYGSRGPCDAGAFDDLDPWDAYLDLSYEFANGIELNSLTGFSHYERENAEDNSGVYYLANYTYRSEFLDQFSQEIRLSSPVGGTWEWMAGLYYQDNNLDLRTIGLRANVRRPARNPRGGVDAEWSSVFGTVTYNFWGDKASLDLGVRYTDVDKFGFQDQYEQLWIFEDVDNPGEEFIIPNGTRHCCNVTRRDFLVDPVYSQYVGATPIGITDEFLGEDTNAAPFTTSQTDPQITFRYRPNENISLYAKYAEAFKSGSFEVELKSTPPPDEFVFDNEYAKSYEVGMKGTFLDGRARANVAIFDTTINDLQVGTELPLAVVNSTGQASATVNAAAQAVQGLEFDTVWAVSDRLTLGLSGALYNGEMESFENAGCTTYESENAADGPCITEEESIALVGDDSLENTIDRTGQPAPRTPDWVYVLSADYAAPISSRYELTFNGRFKVSDGYLTDIESFEKVITMPQHEDLNLLIGFGEADGSWRLALYGRNLLEPRKEYNPEFDLRPNAFVNTALPQSAFRTYGVQFIYRYN